MKAPANKTKRVRARLRTQIPSLVIIVPVFNAQNTIAPCVDSILQSIRRTSSSLLVVQKIILVDNASTDNSKKIMEEYVDKRISIISCKIPGRSATRNAGLAWMKSTMTSNRVDYVLFTDSDCVVPVDWIQKIVSPLISSEELSKVQISVGAERTNEQDYLSKSIQHLNETHRIASKYDESSSYLDTKNCAMSTTVASLLFDENLPTLEDLDLAIRAKKIGVKTVFVDDCVVTHIHVTTLRALIANIFERGIAYRRICTKYSFTPHAQKRRDWTFFRVAYNFFFFCGYWYEKFVKS